MTWTEGSAMERVETAQVLSHHSEEIRSSWLEMLNTHRKEEGGPAVGALLQDMTEGKDLLSILINQMSGRVKDKGRELQPVLDRVRRTDYSLDDLLQEMTCLEDATEDVLRRSKEATAIQVLDAMNHVRKALASYSRSIARETSEIYERVMECGPRGFCLFDTKGVITFASEKMTRLLGTPSTVGMTLDELLGVDGSMLMREALSSTEGAELPMRRLISRHQGNQTITLGVEMAPLFDRGERRGGYLCAIDLSKPTQLEKMILDTFPLAAFKLTIKDGKFTYMNPEALKLLKIDDFERVTLRDVFPDEENYSKVMKQLHNREEFRGNEYEAEGTRGIDKQKVPIRVTARPELDLQGNVVGSLALVRDITPEKVAAKINKFISSTNNCEEYLENTAKAVKPIVPFHIFIVTQYSKDGAYLRNFYSYEQDVRMKSEVRWWKISEPLRDQLQGREVSIMSDYEEYFSRPSFQPLREFDFLRKEGIKSSMRCPVVRGDKAIAAITFLSRDKNTYGNRKEDGNGNVVMDMKYKHLVEALPLEKAVLTALNYEEIDFLKFRLDLIREIVTGDKTMHQVAEIVVEGLGKRLDWDHIALYRVDKKKKRFILIYQFARSEEARLDEPYDQPLTGGILGDVYKLKKPLRISNTEKEARYVSAIKNMKSECCLPLSLGNRVHWLLNIEDSQENAFSKEDEKNLIGILETVAIILDRMWTRHYLRAILESTSDMIFMTDSDGGIYKPNKETLTQLEYTQEELNSKNVRSIFAPPGDAEDVLNSTGISYREFHLRRKSGGNLPVALSMFELPEEIDGKAIICRDLTTFRRRAELENLKRMYNEVAVQTQVPLALATSWIQGLQKSAGDSSISDTLDKTLRQLKKVEITYSRLALLDRELKGNMTLISPTGIVKYIKSAFPLTEIARIDFPPEGKLPYLKGDMFQLTFCFETILSYLLRYLPQEKRIDFKMLQDEKGITTRITGFLPGLKDDESIGRAENLLPDEDDDPTLVIREISNTLMQMALGNEIIKKFVDYHNGTYNHAIGENQEAVFEIRVSLPRKGG